VRADDIFFAPTCLTGVRARTVTVTVTNRGRVTHNLSVPDQGIDQDVTAGQTITASVQVVAGKSLVYFCKYHKSSGMFGALLPQGLPGA